MPEKQEKRESIRERETRKHTKLTESASDYECCTVHLTVRVLEVGKYFSVLFWYHCSMIGLSVCESDW